MKDSRCANLPEIPGKPTWQVSVYFGCGHFEICGFGRNAISKSRDPLIRSLWIYVHQYPFLNIYIYIHIYIYVAQLFVAILMSKSNKYPIEAHIRHPGAMFFFYLGFGRIKVPNLTYLKKTPRLINFYLILNNNRTSLTTKIHDHFILKCWVFLSGGSIFRHRNDMCGCSESTLGSWFLQ